MQLGVLACQVSGDASQDSLISVVRGISVKGSDVLLYLLVLFSLGFSDIALGVDDQTVIVLGI